MKLRGVEAARGIAAALVVTLHVTTILADPKQFGRPVFDGLFTFGRAGVDFFFVLSGFIISYVHAADLGRPERFLSYWRKRLWRIYPIYWVVTLMFQALLVASPTRDRAEQDWGHVLASWTLFPEQAAPILGVGWSLRHEMLFYGLFGLMLLNRTLGRAVLAAWAAGICLDMGTTMVTGQPFFTGAAHVIVFRVFNIQFFFGLAVSQLVRAGAWRPGLMLALGTGLFLANGLLESFGPAVPPEWPPRHLAYAMSAGMALYGLATLDRTGRSRVPEWLVVLGGASYSIYLLHVLVVLLLVYALRILHPVFALPIEVEFLGLVGSALLGGVVLSRLVEQPLLQLARTSRAAVAKPA